MEVWEKRAFRGGGAEEVVMGEMMEDEEPDGPKPSSWEGMGSSSKSRLWGEWRGNAAAISPGLTINGGRRAKRGEGMERTGSRLFGLP
jgi:hypothetical protein